MMIGKQKVLGLLTVALAAVMGCAGGEDFPDSQEDAGVPSTLESSAPDDEIRTEIGETSSALTVNLDGIAYDTDRAGFDYKSFTLKQNDPRACRTACIADFNCQAFTHVAAGLQGTLARCYLKNAVPNATTGTSGIDSGIVRAGWEEGIDRVGGDYKTILEASGRYDTAMDCWQMCAEDSRCAAYTFVPRGVQGAAARCYLKNSVRTPSRSATPDLVSGLVRNAGLEYAVWRGNGDIDVIQMSRSYASGNRCRASCSSDSSCKSFRFVQATSRDAYSWCYLNKVVRGPVFSPSYWSTAGWGDQDISGFPLPTSSSSGGSGSGSGSSTVGLGQSCIGQVCSSGLACSPTLGVCISQVSGPCNDAADGCCDVCSGNATGTCDTGNRYYCGNGLSCQDPIGGGYCR